MIESRLTGKQSAARMEQPAPTTEVNAMRMTTARSPPRPRRRARARSRRAASLAPPRRECRGRSPARAGRPARLSQVHHSLVKDLLLIAQDFTLVGENRGLVGQDLVELLLVIPDRLLVGQDRGLIGGDLIELRLVLLNRLLVGQDLLLVAENRLLIGDDFIGCHGCFSANEESRSENPATA